MIQNLADREILVGRQPSMRDRCPRKGCGAVMLVGLQEHSILYSCPAGHYECREVSGVTKLAFHEAQLACIKVSR